MTGEDRIGPQLELGQALLARGEYDRAGEALRAALAEGDGPTAAVHNALGMLGKYTGRFDEAEELLRRAISMFERAYGSEHVEGGLR